MIGIVEVSRRDGLQNVFSIEQKIALAERLTAAGPVEIFVADTIGVDADEIARLTAEAAI